MKLINSLFVGASVLAISGGAALAQEAAPTITPDQGEPVVENNATSDLRFMAGETEVGTATTWPMTDDMMDAESPWMGGIVQTQDGRTVGEISSVYRDAAGMNTALVSVDPALDVEAEEFMIRMGSAEATADSTFRITGMNYDEFEDNLGRIGAGGQTVAN